MVENAFEEDIVTCMTSVSHFSENQGFLFASYTYLKDFDRKKTEQVILETVDNLAKVETDFKQSESLRHCCCILSFHIGNRFQSF